MIVEIFNGDFNWFECKNDIETLLQTTNITKYYQNCDGKLIRLALCECAWLKFKRFLMLLYEITHREL